MTEDKNSKDSQEKKEDEELLTTLRPTRFRQVVGRKKEKKNLEIMIEATLKRNEALDHILFYGPPGLGKTTLAHVISNEIGSDIFVTSGPAIERQGDLASILTNIPRLGILFIDEIHRLNKTVEEMLYPAMEDRALDIIIGKGPSAKTLRLELEDFTIIGATTRIGLISSPMRNRFGANFRLDFYKPSELRDIVLQKSRMLNSKISKSAAGEVAKRSRGTARIAISHFKRVRDYAEVEEMEVIDDKTVKKVLKMHDVDSAGLDYVDRKILKLIIQDFNGGPVGVSTIAAALSEELSTVSDVYEPYLIQAGFLKRTRRGRVATQKAYEHMGFEYPEEVKGQSKLDV